jgi:methionyl-tRNA synthetase
MVIADILKRWRTVCGDKDAQLLTGTDEHGMKVEENLSQLDFLSKVLTVWYRSSKPPLPREWIPRLFAI